MSVTVRHGQNTLTICGEYERCKAYLDKLDARELKAINDLLLLAHSRVNAAYRRKIIKPKEKMVKKPVTVKEAAFIQTDEPETVGDNDLIF